MHQAIRLAGLVTASIIVTAPFARAALPLVIAPSAVERATKIAANGGEIVCWQKRGPIYFAIVEKNGRRTELAVDSRGQVLRQRCTR